MRRPLHPYGELETTSGIVPGDIASRFARRTVSALDECGLLETPRAESGRPTFFYRAAPLVRAFA
jgi:hypothetical protein